MTEKDKKKETFGMRLQQRMTELSVTRSDISSFTSISLPCLYNYLHDTKTPRPARLKRLCQFLKVSSDWLLYGLGTPNLENNQEFLTRLRDVSVPILKHSQVTDWIYHDIIPSSCERIETYLITGGKAMSMKSYAIRVIGPSMVSIHNPGKSLHDGDIVIIDPDIKPKEGSLVVCKVAPDGIRLREYHADGDAVVLQPLDPQYQTLYLADPNVKILGVVTKKLQLIFNNHRSN